MSNTTYDGLTFEGLLELKQRPDQLPPSKLEYLIEPELPKGQLILLTGKPKHGKSILALTWAIEVGLNGTPVFYLDRENPAVAMQDRFKRFPNIPGNLLYWGNWMKKGDELLEPPSMQSGVLVEIVAQMAIPPLIIIDNFSTFGSGFDENSNTDVNKFINCLRPLLALGCTILLLHHPGKKTTKARGASAFEAAADVALTVESEFASNKFITKMMVECSLTRNGNVEDQKYTFVDGVPVRVKAITAFNPSGKILEILDANPGLTKEQFTDLVMKKTSITMTLVRSTVENAKTFGQLVYEKRNGDKRAKLYAAVKGAVVTCH